MSIVLVLVLLIVSFLLLGGLVRFSENIIGDATSVAMHPSTADTARAPDPSEH